MRLRLPVSLSVAAVLNSCGRPPTNAQKASPPSWFADAVPPSHAADDVGRFLSALSVEDDESFRELDGQGAWIAHPSEVDRLWKKVGDQLAARRKATTER